MKNEPKLSAEIEKRFDEAVRKQNNYGNPYWPDWDSVKSFLATALEEQKQETLSEVEGWMVELRKQAGLCNDAANSHLEQQRASRLVEMICDIVAKLEEMKK